VKSEIGFDIALTMSTPNAVIFMLNVNPDRTHDLVIGDAIIVEPGLPMTSYIDVLGNHCGRVDVPHGVGGIRLRNTAGIHDSGLPDPVDMQAVQLAPPDLPPETLQFLLPSCSVPCDHVPVRSWPLFRAREVMPVLIKALKQELSA
jgi:hypothetical protein